MRALRTLGGGARLASGAHPGTRCGLCSALSEGASEHAAAAVRPTQPHVPVLLNEVVAAFEGRRLRVFVDATLGAGGHAAAILAAHPELELYVGLDADPEALALGGARLRDAGHGSRVRLVHGNFGDYGSLVAEALRAEGRADAGVDGILADFGVSSMQLDAARRGFSFSKAGPLDMRMDTTQGRTAWHVVNETSERELGRILRDFGEQPRWRDVARAIVAQRALAPIDSTEKLRTVVEAAVPLWQRRKRRSSGGAKGNGPRTSKRGIHPATQTFQALRIEVNGELASIDRALPAMIASLAPSARMGVISFHSLEDRRVKTAFREAAGLAGHQTRLTKAERYTGVTASDTALGEASAAGGGGHPLCLPRRRPIVPTDEEVEANPRARSAKFRIADRAPERGIA